MSDRRKVIDRVGTWHRQPYTPPARPQLMPHQIHGAAFMTAQEATLLASEPGTGKSAQIVEVINRLPITAKILILCPSGLRRNWLKECALWLTAPRRCMIAGRYIPTQAQVIILQYDALAKFEVQLRGISWDLIALDEAHQLRNADSLKAEQILGSRWTTKLQAKKRIVATATPIQNRPADLWPLLSILGVPIARSMYESRFTDAKNINACPDISGLRQLLAPYLLRQTKAECLNLPAKTRRIIRIEPSGELASAVAEQNRWEDEAKRAGRFEHKIKREQLTAQRIRTALLKLSLPAVRRRLYQTVQQEGKLVIFANHYQVVEAIAGLFAPQSVVTYTGQHNPRQRDQAVFRFQHDPSCCVIVLTIGAGGVGITLTAARRAIFFEYAWNEALMEQAGDRIHRIGQTKPCLLEYFVVPGSVDSRSIELQVEKQATVDGIFQKAA